MNEYELMQARHSVRNFTSQPVPCEARTILEACCEECNAASGLHLQLIWDEPECFSGKAAHYGKFTGVRNYIALVGHRSPGFEAACGYYGQKLVILAQSLGLNSCWVALTYSRHRCKAQLGPGDSLLGVIALGYGVTQGVPHKSRPVGQVCRLNRQMPVPEWFKKGMRAALLAPTAMNQQKFCIILQPDGTVQLRAGRGFYTRVDIGIVQYNFEKASGHFTVLL